MSLLRWIVVLLFVGLFGSIAYFTLISEVTYIPPRKNPPMFATSTPAVKPGTSTPTISGELPKQKILSGGYHVSQTFNNCAPAALSMAMSHYGIYVGQDVLAASLRPANNLKGINDDKSTTPDELAREAAKYGLVGYYRPHGDIEMLKKFIAADIPVAMRTLLHANEDFAHYRVVKGYDDTTGEIIQDDGYEGANLRFSYAKFNQIWQPFNYAYLVLVHPSKQKQVEAIIGEDLDTYHAWQNALEVADAELAKNPSDLDAAYNRSTAYYYLGKYEESAKAYEKIESRLPMRTIWYQIEPIQSYFELGNYPRVFSLTDTIINNKNPAYSELYLLRGYSYVKQGDTAKAKAEFEKAVLYNKNLKSAQEALASVSSN